MFQKISDRTIHGPSPPGNLEPIALGANVGLERSRWAPRIMALQNFSGPNDFGSETPGDLEPSASGTHVGLERSR